MRVVISVVQKGVVVHEIGHAIGWFHEQSRPDRDRHIRVNFNLIPAEWHSQFDKVVSLYILCYFFYCLLLISIYLFIY
jgi:hypothetical protein